MPLTRSEHTQVIYVSIDTLMESEKERTSNHSIETIIIVDAVWTIVRRRLICA